jgi:hypothetical protein
MLAGRGIFRDVWLDERDTGLGVVLFGSKSAFHIFGKLRAKEVGPTEGRQLGVCMNHTSYHLHMPAHLHIVYKEGEGWVRHRPCPDSPSHSQKAPKIASPTAKARGYPSPGPDALQEDSRTQWKMQKATYTWPHLPRRMLTCMSYPWF